MAVDIPKELIDAVKGRKLVVFTGAGVSMKEGLPSWGDIVSKMLDEKREYIGKATSYKAALDSGVMEPLEVLDKIESSKKHIYACFEKAVNSEGIKSKFIAQLGDITSRFVTTNFDTLLEDNIPALSKITKDSAYNLTKIDTEDSYVLKLHGDVGVIDNCVIFSKQYDEIYLNDHLAEFQLKKLLTQYTVLFIGFSFSDKYVRSLFERLAEMMGGLGPSHYIVSKDSLDYEWLHNINIKEHVDLDELVDGLAKSVVSDGDGSKSKEKIEIAERVIKADGSDIPPVVKGWVGRNKEIEALNKDFKVYFITGLGGQGKSALAAHYLELVKADEVYQIYDWRDFKEEDHKFENKIISMIMLVKGERDSQNKYTGLSSEVLVGEFFEALSNKKSIFVLDNIDSYIDLEDFEPLGGVGLLFNKAVTHDHNSKFIFTCRPFVRLASIDFFQLPLGGLSENDVINYFNNACLSINHDAITQYAIKSYELTKGHPLWISLIVAQAKRGEVALESFLNSITRNEIVDDDQSSIMSEDILGKIWSSLNDKHKIVLRSLAESVQSLTIDDFSEIVSSELTYNKFIKSYKSIKNLGLVIEKSGGEYVELHPLVKEFIRKRFPGDERTKYIYMFIKYYDKLVLVLKPKLSGNLTFDDYSNWTNKIELYSNAKDYQKALDAMYEVHDAIKSAGYLEEYLRVALVAFRNMKWTRRNIASLNNFDGVFSNTIKSAIEYGDNELVDILLSKYESIVENKDPSYIKICEARTYKHWFDAEYEEAIEIAEKANFLLKTAKQPESSALNHDHALALRDSGNGENMNKALSIFLSGNSIEQVADDNTVDSSLGGVFYGNIGRCLQNMKRYNESLNCLFKAFRLIYDADSGDRLINLGYAGEWLSAVLRENGEIDSAYYYYRFAVNSWERSSPPMHNKLLHEDPFDHKKPTIKSIIGTEAWRIESYCYDLVKGRIKS